MSFYKFVPYPHPHPTPAQQFAAFPVLATRTGHCKDDEICVDGLGRGGGSRHGPHAVASCVSRQYFIRMIHNAGKPAGERESLTNLGGKQTRMMVSKADGNTPMEVDKFDVMAVDAVGEAVQSNQCRDCMELKSDTFEPSTKGLKAEATLLTAGAAAGILWLAVLSG